MKSELLIDLILIVVVIFYLGCVTYLATKSGEDNKQSKTISQEEKHGTD
jgi:hypothetical protein